MRIILPSWRALPTSRNKFNSRNKVTQTYTDKAKITKYNCREKLSGQNCWEENVKGRWGERVWEWMDRRDLRHRGHAVSLSQGGGGCLPLLRVRDAQNHSGKSTIERTMSERDAHLNIWQNWPLWPSLDVNIIRFVYGVYIPRDDNKINLSSVC